MWSCDTEEEEAGGKANVWIDVVAASHLRACVCPATAGAKPAGAESARAQGGNLDREAVYAYYRVILPDVSNHLGTELLECDGFKSFSSCKASYIECRVRIRKVSVC